MPDPKNLDNDLAAIKALAEVLDETGLTEIEIERGQARIKISKATAMTAAAPMAYPAPSAAPSPAPAPAQAEPEGPADLSNHPGAVKSPMVGTAYMAPSPTSPPYVKVGDAVSEGQTLMIVEAMKTMNEIKSHKAGKVSQILARDAEPVEFDEALMIID